MKNNRVRLTSYISPDLDDLIQEYMDENNISTKSQALERMLIEFKYMKNELNFLRSVVSGNNMGMMGNMSNMSGNQPMGYYSPPEQPKTVKKKRDKVKDSIDDIFSNMPD